MVEKNSHNKKSLLRSPFVSLEGKQSPMGKKYNIRKVSSPSSSIVPKFDMPHGDKIRQIISLGDIHGDLSVLREQLKAASVATLSEDGTSAQWTGKPGTVLVFLGDIVDGWRENQMQHQVVELEKPVRVGVAKIGKYRVVQGSGRTFMLERNDGDDVLNEGDGVMVKPKAAGASSFRATVKRGSIPARVGEFVGEELVILEAIASLKRQARRNGSAVITIIGNHEAWTSTGNDDYATPMAKDAWPNGDKDQRVKDLAAAYLKEGNTFAIVQVGPWVFCHAGIICAFLDRMNKAMKKNGLIKAKESAGPDADRLALHVVNDMATALLQAAASGGPAMATKLSHDSRCDKICKAMFHNECVWTTRDLGDTRATPLREVVVDIFHRLGLDPERNHMAFGHNIQSFRDDVAHPQYLEILHEGRNGVQTYGGKPTVRRGLPHGINMALLQRNGRTGMLYFVDVGTSWAFSMGKHDLTPDMMWARAPQALVWDQSHHHHHHGSDDVGSITVRRVWDGPVPK